MKSKFILINLCVLFSITCTYAQSPSAILELESTEEGFLPPRMSSDDRDNINVPSDGMIIFNTSSGFINYYDVFAGWLELQPFVAPSTVNVSQSMIIGGSEFRPARSSNGHDSSFGQGGSTITTTGSGRLIAGIPLPIGTTINSVTFYYKDNDATSMMSMELDFENMNQGSFDTVMEYNTTDAFASNTWESQTIFPNHTLEPEKAYRIDIFSSNWGGDMRIKGALINYTLPSSGGNIVVRSPR